MNTAELHPFGRYLAAKRTVDDHALNRVVWTRLADELAAIGRHQSARPLRVLEIGAGIGTMVDRCLEWGLFGPLAQAVDYLAIDAEWDNIRYAQPRLQAQADKQAGKLHVACEAVDLSTLLARAELQEHFDLVIAHAFLDLIDLRVSLPAILALLRPDGLLYATINFDGVTAFEPAVDPVLDARIEELYHRTMDERIVNGQPSGDSRTGRHLLTALRMAGAGVLEAGSSDWLVFAGEDGSYRGDEKFFLQFILGFVAQALAEHPELAPADLARWLTERHRQISDGTLVYLAHQLDILARRKTV